MAPLALLAAGSPQRAGPPPAGEPLPAGGFDGLLHDVARPANRPQDAGPARVDTPGPPPPAPDWQRPRQLRAATAVPGDGRDTDGLLAEMPPPPSDGLALASSPPTEPGTPASEAPVPEALVPTSTDALPPMSPASLSVALPVSAAASGNPPAAALPAAAPPALPLRTSSTRISTPAGCAADPGTATPITAFSGGPTEAAVPAVLLDALVAALPDGGGPSAGATANVAPAASPFAAAMAAASPLSPAMAPPSAPLLAAAPPLAMDQPDWPQRLGEQIHWRLGEGIQEARIEISPRDLGQIDVRLSMDESGLRLHLSAAHAQTRELLQNELPRLRESLQQGGVLLADAQVGREAPGQRQGQHPGQPPTSDGTRTRLASEAEPSAVVSAASPWQRRKGLLDDYA